MENKVGVGIAVFLLYRAFYLWVYSASFTQNFFSKTSFPISSTLNRAWPSKVIQGQANRQSPCGPFQWLLATCGPSLHLREAHGPVTISCSWKEADQAFDCQGGRPRAAQQLGQKKDAAIMDWKAPLFVSLTPSLREELHRDRQQGHPYGQDLPDLCWLTKVTFFWPLEMTECCVLLTQSMHGKGVWNHALRCVLSLFYFSFESVVESESVLRWFGLEELVITEGCSDNTDIIMENKRKEFKMSAKLCGGIWKGCSRRLEVSRR